MKIRNEKKRSRMAAIAAGLPLLVLAACTQPGSQAPNATPTGNSPVGALADTDATSGLPKVPFGRQPCRSLSTDEQKNLGIAKPAPVKPTPGREPDDLAFDNTCDFGYQSIAYTTQSKYAYQRDNLRTSKRQAPADVPGAFYDVLDNLWFADKGYYVVLPNNVAAATREKMAHVIAAKL